jgi:hypothetical protein
MLGISAHHLALFVAALHFMAIVANVKFHQFTQQEV